MEHRRQEPSATAATAAEEEEEFSLREWAVKARMVSRVNTGSRRFSASYATTNTSFREDALTAARSFRSSITTTVSSTASSPGYTFRGEIDPSTYSFTTAIKALQARSSGYNWDCLSPDQGGYTLHSKWNEAEKYICNPLSGQVPLECLSAKTLLSSGRSFRHNIPGSGRVTMSAPLIYHPPPHSKIINNHVLPSSYKDHKTSSIQDKQPGTTAKRDVGIQSTPPELSSSTSTGASTSPATPPIKERSITKREIEEEDSPSSNNTDNTKLTEKMAKTRHTPRRSDPWRMVHPVVDRWKGGDPFPLFQMRVELKCELLAHLGSYETHKHPLVIVDAMIKALPRIRMFAAIRAKYPDLVLPLTGKPNLREYKYHGDYKVTPDSIIRELMVIHADWHKFDEGAADVVGVESDSDDYD